MLNWKEKIYYFFVDGWDTFLYTLSRVWKVISWVPVIWKDRDWTDEDILRLLDFKLSFVQKCLQNDPYHLDEKTNKPAGPIYAKQVKEVRDCIDRILKNEYIKKERAYHDKKWGQIRVGKGKKIYNNGKLFGETGEIEPNCKAAVKYRDKMFRLYEERENADYKKLFQLLHDNHRSWWV